MPPWNEVILGIPYLLSALVFLAFVLVTLLQTDERDRDVLFYALVGFNGCWAVFAVALGLWLPGWWRDHVESILLVRHVLLIFALLALPVAWLQVFRAARYRRDERRCQSGDHAACRRLRDSGTGPVVRVRRLLPRRRRNS